MSTSVATAQEALVLTAYGNPASLEISARDVAEPEPGEVLVRVMASPINPSDLIFMEGRNPSQKKLPCVPGFEGSGTVVKSGGGAEADALAGKNVAFRSHPSKDGAWAKYAVVSADRCIPLLPSVSFTAGAMLLVNPLTAWTLVDSAQKSGHKCAIQNAAASALGRMIVKFAVVRNLEMINIVRKTAQMELLKQLGARYILNSESANFEDELRKKAKECHATVAFDAIAGSAANRVLRAMPRGSELWSYCGLSAEPLHIDPMVLIYEEKAVRGFWGPPTFYKLQPEQFDAACRDIQERIDTTFKTDIHKTFSLRQYPEALSDYKSNMTRGKVLFVMDEE